MGARRRSGAAFLCYFPVRSPTGLATVRGATTRKYKAVQWTPRPEPPRHKDTKPSLGERPSPACIPQLCAQQPVDQTAQAISAMEDRCGDLDPASSHQDEIALHFLLQLNQHTLRPASPGTPLALPMDPNTLPVDRIRAAGSRRQGAGSGPQRRFVEDPDPVICCRPPAARAPDSNDRCLCITSAAPAPRPAPGALLGCGRSQR